jgi:hypothetical protein
MRPRCVGWAKRTRSRCRHQRNCKRAHHSHSADDGGHGAVAPLPTLRSCMTADRILAAGSARVLHLRRSPQKIRAQGMPVHERTRSLACIGKKARKQVTTGPPKPPTFPARLVLTAYTCSLRCTDRCTGLVSHRRLADHHRKARPQRREARTTRFRRPLVASLVSRSRPRPSQPASRFVTIGRNVPLNEAGWAATNHNFPIFSN